MNYFKGQTVRVKDYRGKLHEKVVWKDDGDTVQITSQEVYLQLNAGRFYLWAIPFPKTKISPVGNKGDLRSKFINSN
ncbi:hypothetical protein BH09VER1_BH09VER1_34180 [soil metagenome]